MANTWYWTPSALKKIMEGDLDLNAAGTFSVDLLEVGHDINTDFETTDYNLDDVTGVCNDAGYSKATATLTVGVIEGTTNDRVEIQMADGLTFGTSTSDVVGAILYKDTGTPSTSAIIAVCKFDAHVQSTSGTITMNQTDTNNVILYLDYTTPTLLTS